MIEEYKKTLKKPLTTVTNLFLLRDTEVLLGLKKRGFGKGNYVGIGGKVDAGETIEQAAIREFSEETKVQLTQSQLKNVGLIRYYFPHVPDESWNLMMHVFTAKFEGENPIETDEVMPVWFPKNALPFDQMWDDAQYWIPEVLNGKFVEKEFLYNEDLSVLEHVAIH